MYKSFSDISKEQKQSFDYKVQTAVDAIAEGFKVSGETARLLSAAARIAQFYGTLSEPIFQTGAMKSFLEILV